MANSVRFLHIREITNVPFPRHSEKGGKTICYHEDEEGNIWYAIAKCSSKDNFCRRIGREVSSGRLRVLDMKQISKEERMKLEQTGQKFNVIDLLFRAEGWDL